MSESPTYYVYDSEICNKLGEHLFQVIKNFYQCYELKDEKTKQLIKKNCRMNKIALAVSNASLGKEATEPFSIDRLTSVLYIPFVDISKLLEMTKVMKAEIMHNFLLRLICYMSTQFEKDTGIDILSLLGQKKEDDISYII